MSERHEKAPGEFLLDLITSDMNLSRAFAAVSRSAYGLGKSEQGDFARLKAVNLYSEAAKLASQLPAAAQDSLRKELQALSATVNWLFMKSIAQVEPRLDVNEYFSRDNPPFALGEK